VHKYEIKLDSRKSARSTSGKLIKVLQFIQDKLIKEATHGNKLEKKLGLLIGGYQARSRMLRQKIIDASEAVAETTRDLSSFRTLKISETDAIPRRLEILRNEVAFLDKREREAQETYRTRKEELLVSLQFPARLPARLP